MKSTHYKQFNETVHTFQVQGRLEAVIVEKPNFHKTYVSITTPLGSIHRGILDEQNVHYDVPAGVAHFLEHKIFEQDGMDISRLFSMHEAQINAFTEHNRTTYLFNATNHIIDNIKRLISMVFYPKFSAAGVEKEKNIITEELNMYLDDPHYLQYKALLSAMYGAHPIKEDILGTRESIAAIDESVLKHVHAAYYAPERCSLIIVGDVDAQTIENALTETPLPAKTSWRPAPFNASNGAAVETAHIEGSYDVLTPGLLLGIRRALSNGDAQSRIKDRLAFSMAIDLMFGSSSTLYERLMREGLINDSYGLDMTLEKEFGYVLIGSETNNPDVLEDALRHAVKTASQTPISDEDYERVKRSNVGSFLMSLDSLSYLAHEMSRFVHEGLMFYDVLAIAQSITKDDLTRALQSIDASHISASIARMKA